MRWYAHSMRAAPDPETSRRADRPSSEGSRCVPPKFIAILEDHPARAAAMRLALARFYPQFNVIIYRDAPEMIRWLDRIIGQAALISLDHDLLPCDPPDEQGRRPWPGTGREVVDHLATSYPCVCPVIVHTSNAEAAPGM